MKPIYVVIYHECDDISSVGAFMCYQDAVDAMKEDMTKELMYMVHDRQRAEEIIAQASESEDEVLSNFEEYPSLVVWIDTYAGQATLGMYHIGRDWTILEIDKVVENQSTEEQEEQK